MEELVGPRTVYHHNGFLYNKKGRYYYCTKKPRCRASCRTNTEELICIAPIGLLSPSISATEVLASGNTPPSFTPGRPGGPESGPIPERTTTSCSASRHSPLSIRYGCYPSISATEVLASGNTPPSFTPGRPGGPESGPIPERTTTSCSASRHSPLSIRYGCYPSISATEVLASGNTPPSFTSGRPGGPESGPIPERTTTSCSASRHSPLSIRYGCYPSISATEVLASGNTPPTFTPGRPGGPESGPIPERTTTSCSASRHSPLSIRYGCYPSISATEVLASGNTPPSFTSGRPGGPGSGPIPERTTTSCSASRHSPLSIRYGCYPSISATEVLASGNTPPSFTSGRPGGPGSGPIPERTTTSCSASRHSPLSIRYGCYPSISATEVLASGNTPPSFTSGRPGGPESGPIPERTTTSCSASRHSPLSIRYGCYPSISATEVLASGNTPPSFTPGRPGGPESGPIPERTTTSCSASRHSPLSIRYGCYPSISATEVLASGNTPPSFTPGRPGGPESGPIPERTTTSCSASRHSPLSIRYGCYPSISATEVLASGNTPPSFTPGRPGGPESGPIPERTTTSCSASRHSPLSIRYGCYPSISATEVGTSKWKYSALIHTRQTWRPWKWSNSRTHYDKLLCKQALPAQYTIRLL
ncbi:hypothetical protein M8J77_000689 [Diaphorina citri]|nr:hypothetical protein M8J77_000689 [Diaphorina citri]